MDSYDYVKIRIDSGNPPIAFLHTADYPVTKFETYNLSKVNVHNIGRGKIIKLNTDPPTLLIKNLGIRLELLNKGGDVDIYKADLQGKEINLVRESLEELSD